MKESGLVLYEDTFLSVSLGTSCNVEFDFFKIWQFKKDLEKLKEEFDPSLLRFYHVHPSGFLHYSETDLNCISGLNKAFGYPVHFSILTFENGDLDYLGCNYVSYQYINKKMKEIGTITLDKKYLSLLKILSYEDIFYGDLK